jgi:hypothetical protein
VIFIYRQTLDPGAYWRIVGPIPLIVAYIVLTLAGLSFYGIAFRQGGLPDWMGYLMLVSSVILMAAFLALRGGGAFFLSVLIYAITFAAGIVLWRQ